jgi:uncharacterized protein YdeI (YjbR/CyaY-like superfamily)
MSRKQSIFSSTKGVVQTTATIIEETAGLVVDQVRVTRALNKAEDEVELKEAQIQGVVDVANATAIGYEQLAKIEAMAIPDEVKAKLKANLLEVIS